MAVESKSNDCLETMSLRESRLCSPLSSSRLVMMILMQSRTKTVHEKSICIQKLLSLFSLMLSSFTTPSSESSLSYMSSLLHPSRLCFTDPVDLRFYFFLNPISSTSAQSLIQIVDLSCLFYYFRSALHTHGDESQSQMHLCIELSGEAVATTRDMALPWAEPAC